MTKHDDGGPVAPPIESRTVGANGDYRQEIIQSGGMSLADWFAGNIPVDREMILERCQSKYMTLDPSHPMMMLAEAELRYEKSAALIAEKRRREGER